MNKEESKQATGIDKATSVSLQSRSYLETFRDFIPVKYLFDKNVFCFWKWNRPIGMSYIPRMYSNAVIIYFPGYFGIVKKR